MDSGETASPSPDTNLTSTSQTGEMLKLCDEVAVTCKKFRGLLEKYEHLLSSYNAKQGVSLFNIKSDAMFTYICNLLFVMLKKSCGLSIQDPQTRERIGQVRVILEKMKPLELKLKYQIEKYIKMTQPGQSGGSVVDKSKFRAKIENLQNDDGNDENNEVDDDDNNGDDEGSDGDLDEDDSKGKKSAKNADAKANAVYRPPKVAAVPYDDSREEDKRKRRLEQAKKRALSTSIIQELKEEYLDTPLEIASTTTLRNKRTNYRQERESYEETYFTRLPTTKKERHRDKQMASLTLGTLGTEVTRFEDISALDERTSDRSNKRKKTPMKKNKGFKKRRTR